MLLAGAEARAWQTPQGLCERRHWRRDGAQDVYAAGPFPPCSNTGSGEQRCCRWWSETGQLTCTLGDFFKTVYAWQPEVSAVNRTAGLDSETVWWVTQFYYSQDANILNGSAWFGDGWNQWFYTYADDSTWWPDAFTDYNTRTRHTGIAAFNTFDSYSVAAHNWVWYSSTGGWRDFWSSDGAGRPVTCGIQARLRPF